MHVRIVLEAGQSVWIAGSGCARAHVRRQLQAPAAPRPKAPPWLCVLFYRARAPWLYVWSSELVRAPKSSATPTSMAAASRSRPRTRTQQNGELAAERGWGRGAGRGGADCAQQRARAVERGPRGALPLAARKAAAYAARRTCCACHDDLMCQLPHPLAPALQGVWRCARGWRRARAAVCVRARLPLAYDRTRLVTSDRTPAYGSPSSSDGVYS